MTKTVNITNICLRSNLGGVRSHHNHLDHFSIAAVLSFHFHSTYLQLFGIYKTYSRRPANQNIRISDVVENGWKVRKLTPLFDVIKSDLSFLKCLC